MKCFITGINGFIGQELAVTLIQAGHSVVGCSRLELDGSSDRQPHFVVGTIGGDTDWTKVLVGQDCMIHLANMAHVMDQNSAVAMEAYRDSNVLGSLKLARAALESGVNRFIYLSSIKVNGESTHGEPFSTEDLPDPQDCYAYSKYEAEVGLQELCAGTSMELVIIRPPLVYGPKAKGNLATLAGWIDKGRPLPVAALENQRDLIGLSNLVDLIMTCIGHPKAAGQVFLCSDNRPLSTPELIRFIANARQQPIRLWKFPPKILKAMLAVVGKQEAYARLAGDLRIDMRHTQEVLGWTPPYSVEESMQWAFGREEPEVAAVE